MITMVTAHGVALELHDSHVAMLLAIVREAKGRAKCEVGERDVLREIEYRIERAQWLVQAKNQEEKRTDLWPAPDPAALHELASEMQAARVKFPSNAFLTVALGEEYGELCQAELQRQGRARIRREALQTACVAMRIFEEGDATMEAVNDEAALP